MPLDLNLYHMGLILLSLFFIIDRLLKFFRKEKGQSFFKVMATLVIWTSVIIIILFPTFTHTISVLLGFGSNLNTLIFIGFIIVFLVVFKLLNIVEKQENSITEIIRREALKDIQYFKHKQLKK